MSLFSFLTSRAKKQDNSSLVIGYLRNEASKHIGHPVDSKEYEKVIASAFEHVESVLLPALKSDKQHVQEVFNTLSLSCGERVNEAFGAYLGLLWIRFGIIQHAIAAGKVKPEEGTLGVISIALLGQIKRLVANQ